MRVLTYILEICDGVYAWVACLNTAGNLPDEQIQFAESVEASSMGS